MHLSGTRGQLHYQLDRRRDDTALEHVQPERISAAAAATEREKELHHHVLQIVVRVITTFTEGARVQHLNQRIDDVALRAAPAHTVEAADLRVRFRVDLGPLVDIVPAREMHKRRVLRDEEQRKKNRGQHRLVFVLRTVDSNHLRKRHVNVAIYEKRDGVGPCAQL